MNKTQINPFDSKSENRYKAFRQMRAEAPVHETSTGARFIVSQQAVSEVCIVGSDRSSTATSIASAAPVDEPAL